MNSSILVSRAKIISYGAIVVMLAACGGGSKKDNGNATNNPATYTISVTASAGGSISPLSRTVNEGAITAFNVTANPNFTATASGCGGNLNGNVYTTGPIYSNCTVNAIFTQIPPTTHTVTVSHHWIPVTSVHHSVHHFISE